MRTPDFHGRDRRFALFRTRISQGVRSGANFAGHFAVISIGCGTGCSITYLADVINGQVFSFPVGTDGVSSLELRYTVRSNLIVGQLMSDERCLRRTFLWQGRKMRTLNSIDLGPADVCFEPDRRLDPR